MLYFRSTGGFYSGEWHVGERPPKNRTLYDCYLIQADGDELDYILSNFSNIPKTNKKLQVWTGDFANFIWQNL